MKELHKIQKLKFIRSSFNLETMRHENIEHYEVSRDGHIESYLTHGTSRKRDKRQQVTIPAPQAERFLDSISDILEAADHPVLLVDDCARRWVINCENFKIDIVDDLETRDGRYLEKAFWEFVEEIEGET